jgi:transcriptional regulator with XRE-family HTH domain
MIGTGRPAQKEAPPFGRRLREARLARGWTQAELADQLGISSKMMDYYERRAANPSVKFVRQAAEVLDVSVEELVGAPERKAARAKPGPKPLLVERIERVRRLPRKDQEFVLQFLDAFLERAEKAS